MCIDYFTTTNWKGCGHTIRECTDYYICDYPAATGIMCALRYEFETKTKDAEGHCPQCVNAPFEYGV